RLLKAYELFGEDATTQGRTKCVEIAKSLAQEAGLDPEIYVGLDAPSADTFDDSKDRLTVLFPDQTERRPGEVSFLLGRLRGQTLCRPRVIYPPEIRDQLLEELGQGPSPHRPGASRGTLAGGSFSHASVPPGHHD